MEANYKLINPNSKLYYVLSVVFSLLLLPIILVGSFMVAFVVVGAALCETLYKLLIYERRKN